MILSDIFLSISFKIGLGRVAVQVEKVTFEWLTSIIGVSLVVWVSVGDSESAIP